MELSMDELRRASLVDTHCHLVLLEERGMLEEALTGAVAGRVEQILSVGLDLEDSDANRMLAERHPGIWFSVGWHPHQVAPPDPQQLAALDSLLRHPRAVAVGEIGLDRFWRPGYHEVPLAVQQQSIHAMFELAAAHAKPVIIHDREAHAEVLEVLDRWPLVKGVMHCFSGDAAFGAACVARGFTLSFAGTITFSHSDGIQAAAASTPQDRFVVETDAPFLAPVPYRGRANRPAYLTATAARVAELRRVTAAEAGNTAAINARRLFGLPDPSDGDVVSG